MGENCGYFNSSSAATKPDSEWGEKVSEMWYDEEKKYDYNKNEYQQQTGHFTQVSKCRQGHFTQVNKCRQGHFIQVSSGELVQTETFYTGQFW